MEGIGGVGGGEVRRIHVVYLLSRMGRMEQPHLFRVHHLARSGVKLKDVKRWLGELRGKNMPEAFSWSYKRRYKAGFVWQDLMDDDLLTPISDNEYVLKGSEIRHSTATIRTNPCFHQEKFDEVKEIDPAPSTPEKELAGDTSKGPPAESNLGGNSKELAGKGSDCSSPSSTSSLSSFSSSSAAAASECSKETKPANIAAEVASPVTPRGGLFRSFLKCGVVDISDAAIMQAARSPAAAAPATPEGLGGSARFLSTFDWFQNGDTGLKCKSFSSLTGMSVKTKKKDAADVNKNGSDYPVHTPSIEPICSQCGERFKPEKLQAHMNSCKGLRIKVKTGSGAATDTSLPFATTVNRKSCSFFL